MSHSSSSTLQMLARDKEEQVKSEKSILQEQQHQVQPHTDPAAATLATSGSLSICQVININSKPDRPEEEHQMSEGSKDKNQQNASKLAIEAATEAVDQQKNPSYSSSNSSSSSSSSSNNNKQNVQPQNNTPSSSSITSNPSSLSVATASVSAPGDQTSSANVNSSGQAGEAKQPEDGTTQAEPVKVFSEKSLQELADYYLSFKPSEIPDSGFVVSGIAGRFPNADNLNELWDNLYHARDMVCGPDDKRWPLGLWDLPKKAARIKDISLFDYEFFGIPKEVADYTDHQLRNLYEVIYESMLDAGLNPAQVRGDKRTGIFFGFHTSETDVEFIEKPHFQTTGYQSQLLTAVTSYFDIQGVAGSYDAACASSFAAFHQAIVNLRSGLCDTAIVCGVNISVRPGTAYQFLLLQMLSPTGSSKFLDASADGYAKTEACVSVILQRKDIAKRSYAAVVHTKCNNDGFKIEGITFPSSKVQETLMMDAITEAGLNPRDVVYVEAHGTGTPAGDPEEARAISKVFAEDRDEPLLIGSVKSNMGHAEGVSGLCSLAKVICTFENELLPQNLHYHTPNPNIQPLLEGRIKPVDKNIPFKHNLIPMNCYGFGGVNVHGIFKTHTRKMDLSRDFNIAPEYPRLITMFGRSQEAIEYAFNEFKRDKDQYGRRLLTQGYLALLDLINEGPIDKMMNYRGYLMVDNNLNEVAQSIVKIEHNQSTAELNGILIKNDNMDFKLDEVRRRPHYQDYRRSLWFVLPGLGCQWKGMAKDLMQFRPIASTIENLAGVLKPLGVDLIDILTNISQNAFENSVVSLFTGIVAIQIALIDLLRLIEVKPDGIVGHSIGEISCAYADGLLSSTETILLAYYLAKPIDDAKFHSGAMAAASLTVNQADEYLSKYVETQRAKLGAKFETSIEVACVNSEESITLSSQREEIDAFIDLLTEENVYARRIADVSTPFHNSSLRAIEKEMIQSAQRVFNNNNEQNDVQFQSNNWISSLYVNQKKSDTEKAQGFEINAQYYVENLCSQVRFKEAMDHISHPEQCIIAEIGPHGLFHPIMKQKYLTKLNYVTFMKRMEGSEISVLKGLGQMYQLGQSFKLANLYPKVEFPVAKGTGSVSSIIRWNHQQKLFVAKYPESFRRPPCEARVKFDLIDESDKYLAGHCVDGRILFPATGYLYLVWRSFSLTMDKVGDVPVKGQGEAVLVPVEFNNVRLYRATILGSAPVELLVRIEEATGQFEVREGGSVVVDGFISVPKVNPNGMQYGYLKDDPSFKDKVMSLAPEDVYKQFRVCGYDYGESFRNIVSASSDGLHVQVKWNGQFIPFSDSVLQSLFLAICKKTSALFLPTKFEYMRINPRMLQEKVELAAAENRPCILDAYCELQTGIIVTDGMEMRGVGASPAPRRQQQDPVLESYQFLPNIERSISDRLTEAWDQKVEQYMEICSTAAYKILSNLQQSKSQIVAVMNGFKMVDDVALNKYLDENESSENHILLQILDKILASQEEPPEPEVVRGGLEGSGDQEQSEEKTGEEGVEAKEEKQAVVTSGPSRKREPNPKLRNIDELKHQFEKVVRTEFDALASKLGNDIMSSAFSRERFLRCLLEIAFENIPTQKVKLLELNTANGIKFEPISNLLGEVLPNLSVNYFLAHPAPNTISTSELPQDTKLYTWNPSYRSLQRDLQDLDIVLYSDSSCYPTKKDQFTSEQIKENELLEAGEAESTDKKVTCHENVEAVFKSAHEVLKPNGFFMVFMRSQLCPAEKFLYKVADYEYERESPERLDMIYEAGKRAKFQLIAEKSDITGCHMLLYRRLETNIKLEEQNLIHIEHEKQASWLEALKKLLEDVKKQSAAETINKNIWLIANDTPYNGIVGMVNCLRKEPGGERIRFILDQRPKSSIKFGRKELDFERVIKAEKEGDEDKKETVKSDAFIDLDTITGVSPDYPQGDQFLINLIKQDLIYNCIDQEGRYGSFRHLTISELLENQKIKTDEAYVNVATRGDLSSFRWYEAPYKYVDLTDEQTNMVTVYCSSLNFRDIMLASGRLPLDALPISIALSDCILGLEFSGVLDSGRRIAGMVGGRGISTKMIIKDKESISFTIPDHISLEEAATIPVVYATAVMALISRGRMKRGESILIHSGSGGVGQAAIRLCLHHGLTVYTTVGNQEKRDFLKEEFPQLTDAHIFNSRTTQFEIDVMRATNGRGVDLVLNSLSEDKLQASVRCLANGGRFLEIGKYDMALNNPVELMLLDTNKTFHGILLDKLFDRETLTDVFIQQRYEMIDVIEKGLQEGYIKPIKRTVFDKTQVEDAFRFMASGKHIGKVIIKIREEEVDPSNVGSDGSQRYRDLKPVPIVMDAQPRTMFDPKKSYIITGGLGGFGLELAKWIGSNGAKNLVLTSRTGVKTGYQRLVVERLTENGTNVIVSSTDNSTDEGAEKLIQEAEAVSPIGGIFNLAMVLRDSLFENCKVEDFDAVCLPKCKGVAALDRATRKLCPDLELFVAFSSVSCGKGNAGQANYGYANSVMERICEQRRRDGLHGLAIQWGAIGDVGVAFDNLGGNEAIIGGTIPQRMPSCFATLSKILASPFSVCLSILQADRRSFNAGKKGDLVKTILHVLGIKDPSTVDPNCTLGELGLDSLMAVEIRQALEREYDIVLTVQEIRALTINRIREIGDGEIKKKATSEDATDSNMLPATGELGLTASNAYATESNAQLVNVVPGVTIGTSATGQKMYTINKELASKAPLALPSNDLIVLNGDTGVRLKGNPIFMIPPIQGDFSRLSLLSKKFSRPCVGICWTTRMARLDNFGDVVKEHISVIRQYYPNLKQLDMIGYSFGAALAFEMMQYVQDTKISPPLNPGKLVLLDGSPDQINIGVRYITNTLDTTDENAQVAELMAAYLMQYHRFDYADIKNRLSQCSTHELKLRCCVDLLTKTLGLKDQEQTKQLEFAIEAFCRKFQVMLSYKAKACKLESDITLIRATEVYVGAKDNVVDEDYGLSKIVSGRINSCVLKGNHESFLDDNVEQISSLLFDIICPALD